MSPYSFDDHRYDQNGVSLFADISGFTKLSEKLAKKGPIGQEELGYYLNRYLERIVKLIIRSGGDVFKFAGDAVLVLWPITEGDDVEKQMATNVHRVGQCCMDIQAEMNEARLSDDVDLSIKLGIGCGNAQLMHLGGVYGRLEYLCTGPSLLQAFVSESKCVAGDTVMSTQAYNLVKEHFRAVKVDDESYKILSIVNNIRNVSLRKEISMYSLEQVAARLKQYIPAAVIPYLVINQKLWAGELRMLSVMFMNLDLTLQKGNRVTDEELAKVQTMVSTIQECIYQYEGSLNKFLVDDKGSTMIGIFGLPPLAHENDPARCLYAALQIKERMNAMGMKISLGVTTGMAFCGLVGSSTRREYSVLGDVVNLSARLMAAAKNGVLCDETTFKSARSVKWLNFKTLDPIKVKGKTQLIPVFIPSTNTNSEFRLKPPPRATSIVGHEHHIDHMLEVIERDCAKDKSKFILLEGEIGAGCTHILRYLMTSRTWNPDVVAWSQGDQFTSEKLMMWKQLFTNLKKLPNWFGDKFAYKTPDEFEQALQNFVASKKSDLVPYLCTLNCICGTSYEENEKATGPKADDAQWDLIVLLLQTLSADRKLILIIDEGHNLSMKEWGLIGRVHDAIQKKKLTNIVFIFGTRPMLNPKYKPMFGTIRAGIVTKLKEDTKSVEQIAISPFTVTDVGKLLASSLDVNKLDDRLVKFVEERSGGRPAFCYKTLSALQRADALKVDGDACVIAPKFLQRLDGILEISIPRKVQRITNSHLDRLSPSQMFVMRVGATICLGQELGRTLYFELEMLKASFPIREYSEQTIEEDVEWLCANGYLKRMTTLECFPEFDEDVDEEHSHLYSFSYGFVVDVIYQLMLYKQRRSIHRLVANYLEENRGVMVDGELHNVDLHTQLAVDHEEANAIVANDTLSHSFSVSRQIRRSSSRASLNDQPKRRSGSKSATNTIAEKGGKKSFLGKLLGCGSSAKSDRAVAAINAQPHLISINSTEEERKKSLIRTGQLSSEDRLQVNYNQKRDSMRFIRKYQRSKEVSPALVKCLAGRDKWDFDIFELGEVSNGHPLLVIGYTLFQDRDFFKQFSIDPDTFFNFLIGIEHGYSVNNNPYHNRYHASDVFQTMHVLIQHLKLEKMMDRVNVFCMMTAALIHDYGHPGTNSEFLLASGDKRATLYTDRKLLENYHVDEAFRFILQPENNILRNVGNNIQTIRQLITELVLATSLYDHPDFLDKVKTRLDKTESEPIDLQQASDADLIMKLLIKTADVSNPAKQEKLSKKWANLITEEFHMQGDLEKSRGLPVSKFMDREKSDVAGSQIGFITFVTEPLYTRLVRYAPSLRKIAYEHVQNNLATWKKIAKEQKET
jgi:class 3 adenylate cyclase